MEHGTQGYFEEIERNARRVSGLSAVLGGLLVLMLVSTLVPWVRQTLHRTLDGTPVLRFGFAGPRRYVEMVQVDAMPEWQEPLRHVGRVISVPSRGGRGGQPAPGGMREPVPSSQHATRRGIGEDTRELNLREQSRRGGMPVFQSEDLIIEHLVRPEYPENARERGIEGRVSVIALVDTLGLVAAAQVTSGSGESQLDSASRDAVLQCRFRPYVVQGRPREVFAEFHFAFRIY